MGERRLNIPFKIEKLLSDLLVALTLSDLKCLRLETIKLILKIKVAELVIAIKLHKGYRAPVACWASPRGGCWEGAACCSTSDSHGSSGSYKQGP